MLLPETAPNRPPAAPPPPPPAQVVVLENEILYGESFPIDDAALDKDFTVPIGKAKVGGPAVPARCLPACRAA